jgi:UDPglucose--hexose-1-phosphate uridylyltransferase
MTNELRKDYLLDKWVVIASHRKSRPTDFVKKQEEKGSGVCPFCRGNEHMTPPAVLVYLSDNGTIIKEQDSNGIRHKDWMVRCVPNLYPAFNIPKSKNEKFQRESTLSRAIGHHEILIESPTHDEHPGVAQISQLKLTIQAYIERMNALYSKTYVRYVSIFRNHGQEAGASLSHAHSQIIATPLISKIQREELQSSENAWMKNKMCVFCSILHREKNGPRFIWENDKFIAFTPWASVHPFEFWIFPKEHQASIQNMRSRTIEALAESLRICFGGLQTLLEDPPYNFGFHTTPIESAQEYYHWHLEVYPKLSIWAGFEKSNGIFINTMSPEDAAESLRKTIQLEEAKL